jgi:hypothetical protein
VTAGLADLEVWLRDQVRTGLAQADRSPRVFETVAARLIDAQAPGPAETLRQLSRNMASYADWPATLLREYARLHLLVTAHRRLDDLDPALAASVRAHIGYPTLTESVREQPPLRDRWQVLAQRITEEDRLFTRRTWVRGRESGRWALIIDHSFAGPGFPTDMPVPGTMIDAEVHFYPGATPLRAVWGHRRSVPEPFTTLPQGCGIVAALDDHARALGADPWLREWPMLLAGVVPAPVGEEWFIVDATGAALPIARSAEAPWRLAGLSGGHPVTVVGRWTTVGLLPMTAFSAGGLVEVSTAAVPGAAIVTADPELTSIALLGTARRSPSTAPAPDPVAAVAYPADDPAAALLHRAALHDLYVRGGTTPDPATTPEPAADDPRPPLPEPAADRLARLIEQSSPLLAEWCAAALPRGFRAPDVLCGLLLDHARRHTAERETLLRLAGARGCWLAARNPRWQRLMRAKPADDTVWSHGRSAERTAWLASLRQHDPAAARTALGVSWHTESGAARSELLAVLAAGLTAADEPLLETALDDTRAEVRRAAAGLLARLPRSAFATRMGHRVTEWFVRTPDPDRGDQVNPHLTAFQNGPDLAARRDGIGDPVPDFRQDQRLGWVYRIAAAAPLQVWETLLGAPEHAVRVRIADWMYAAVRAGWTDAAVAQGDGRWAAALLTSHELALERRRELFAVLAPAEQVRYLQGLDGHSLAELESLADELSRPWPVPVADHILRLLLDEARRAAARPGAPGLSPVSYHSLLHAAAIRFPVEAVGATAVAARRCGDPAWETAFDRLTRSLTERTAMLEELQ